MSLLEDYNAGSPRFLISLLFSTSILSGGCARSQDSGQQCGASPQYSLISVNMRIRYWDTARAGFKKAASELKVKAEMAGPNNYHPKAEGQEFSRVVKLSLQGFWSRPRTRN